MLSHHFAWQGPRLDLCTVAGYIFILLLTFMKSTTCTKAMVLQMTNADKHGERMQGIDMYNEKG